MIWPIVILAVLVGSWWFNREEPDPTPRYLVPSAPASAGSATYWGFDLDCSDFAGPIVVTPGHDPHGLDADHDGIGCE